MTNNENNERFRHFCTTVTFCRGKGGRGSARDQQGESVPEDVKDLFDGDAKKFVNDILVGRQHYLQRVRVQGPDPEVEAYEYSWGERANLEVKKSDILKMVVELYDCEPRMFKEQFDKVGWQLIHGIK